MPTLLLNDFRINPARRPERQTAQYVVWCERCSYGITMSEAPVGTVDDAENLQRADTMRRSHAKAKPGHRARSYMNARYIDMGSDFVRESLVAELAR